MTYKMGSFTDRQKEMEARRKAADDWRNEGCRNNTYDNAAQKMAYDAEFMACAEMFNSGAYNYG